MIESKSGITFFNDEFLMFLNFAFCVQSLKCWEYIVLNFKFDKKNICLAVKESGFSSE